jgi:hypothetical protein
MLEEVIVRVEDKPSALAELGELLGNAGVNIETLAGSNHGGQGVIHIIVDDGEEAAEILKASGFDVVETRDVMTATIEDTPGALGKYCRKLNDAGVAISAVYVAKRTGGETELIFAVDDLETAQGV